MRFLHFVVPSVLSLAACGARRPPESTRATPPTIAADAGAGLVTAFVQSIDDVSACQVRCRQRGSVDMMLALEASEPALISGTLDKAPAAAVAAQLEALRSELLQCIGSEPRQLGLSREHGQLRITHLESTPPEVTRCLDQILHRGVTVDFPQTIQLGLVQGRGQANSSPLTKEAIRGTIQRNIAEVRECLIAHDALPEPGQPALRYLVVFELSAEGEVQCIEALNQAPQLAAFTCCVLPRIASWRFPSTDFGFTRIQYPFLIEATESRN